MIQELSAWADVVSVQESRDIPEGAQNPPSSHRHFTNLLSGVQSGDSSPSGGGIVTSIKHAFCGLRGGSAHSVAGGAGQRTTPRRASGPGSQHDREEEFLLESPRRSRSTGRRSSS